MSEKIVALITTSGRGTRLAQNGIPKQYLSLASMPILRHSILAFLNHQQINDVICVIHPDDVSLYEEASAGLDLLNPVFGGETRQISVRKGLEALRDYNPTKVLIHDGVRPFVSKKVISGILEKLETHQAVIPAIAVEDTIKKYSDGKIEWTVERDDLWRAQTPQGFIYEDILNAHNAFRELNFTDDAALNEYAGIPVAIIPGSQNNFKITTKEDYDRACKMANYLNPNIKEELRVGIGYDVHRFRERKKDEDEFIKIGGVAIKFDKKIEAHSDGDVLIHAIIDSLLGAACLGDIGDHFSDKNNEYKDINSLELLKKIFEILSKKNTTIINIDSTIICERPKISEYKNEMKQKIAENLRISPDIINIKATTTERLGFLGRQEGIAADAISQIRILTL